MIGRNAFIWFTLASLAPLMLWGVTPTTATVTVPATPNPYLAGMPRGSHAEFGDLAPDQSPVLVELSLADAVAVTFSAYGAGEHAPYQPPRLDSPNGSDFTHHMVSVGKPH